MRRDPHLGPRPRPTLPHAFVIALTAACIGCSGDPGTTPAPGDPVDPPGAFEPEPPPPPVAAPTTAQQALYEELVDETRQALAEWTRFLGDDLARFQETLGSEGLPTLLAPKPVAMPAGGGGS